MRLKKERANLHWCRLHRTLPWSHFWDVMVFAEVGEVLVVLSHSFTVGLAHALFQALGLLLSCLLIELLL